MHDHVVDVATAVDAHYLPHLSVVIRSAEETRRPGTVLRFHILFQGEPTRLLRKVERIPSVSVYQVENALKLDHHRGHLSPATLLRFQLPLVLRHLDRVIYLDADTLVQDDLRPLLEAPLAGAAIGAVLDLGLLVTAADHDGGGGAWMKRHFEAIGLPPGYSSYFNAGVLVMDLARLRQIGFTARATALYEQLAPDLAFHDQDVLNLLFRDAYKRLDPRWNANPHVFDGDPTYAVEDKVITALAAQRRDRAVLHFAGPAKPWKDNYIPKYRDRWWKVVNRSAGATELWSAFGDVGRQARFAPSLFFRLVSRLGGVRASIRRLLRASPIVRAR